MIEIKRFFGPEVDQVACNATGLDISHHTVTFLGSQVKAIDEWEDLPKGHRLAGISDVRNPYGQRQWQIINLSHLGYQ